MHDYDDENHHSDQRTKSLKRVDFKSIKKVTHEQNSSDFSNDSEHEYKVYSNAKSNKNTNMVADYTYDKKDFSKDASHCSLDDSNYSDTEEIADFNEYNKECYKFISKLIVPNCSKEQCLDFKLDKLKCNILIHFINFNKNKR